MPLAGMACQAPLVRPVQSAPGSDSPRVDRILAIFCRAYCAHRLRSHLYPAPNLTEPTVKQTFGRRTRGAVTLLVPLLLPLMPALAQSTGGYREYCQQRSNGSVVCRPAAGSAGVAGASPYELWQDGSPARPSGSYGTYRPNPLELGRPNALYNFPR